MLAEEKQQNTTFNYNSYVSNAPIICSVSKINTSFSCAMLSTDCKDLHSQFHGCLTLIQYTKVRIGIKNKYTESKDCFGNQNRFTLFLILFQSL